MLYMRSSDEFFFPTEGILTVSETLALVTASEGLYIPIDRFLFCIQHSRGKRMLLGEEDMPPDITGYSLACSDYDYICTRKGLNPRRKRRVIGHEGGHFLMKHIPRFSNGADTPTLKEYLNNREKWCYICHYRSLFNEEWESAAEEFALLMDERFEKYYSSVPPTAAKLYR